jgi:hypothetical protein
MKRTSLKNHIEAFKSEAGMLLRFQLAIKRISKFEDRNQISRSDLVDRLIALKALENDILIRICKLDDTTKGVHSFPKALNEIDDSHPNKDLIFKNVKLFSQLISKVKSERRHTQLAHLKIGVEDNDYEIRYDFSPVIKLIVDLIDLMSTDSIKYKWSDGQYEKFDLRHEIFGETIKDQKAQPEISE